MTDTANAPGCAFEFNTQGKAPSQKTKRIPPGLYTVSWKDGGTSEVAIGMTSNGDNWMAPTNWLRPAMIHSVEGDVWGSFERLERINATHCDELVAAAYLDAGWRIEQCLWSYHWYLDGESVDPEDLSRGILKRTPDNARAALTAYGERMKAEGARDAQAKIARLTEALKDAVEIVHKSYVLATMEAVNAGPASPIAASHDAWRAKCVRAEEAARAALQENANG